MTTTTLPVDQAARFQRLEALLWQCREAGANKNDQAITLITACIEEGITAGPAIVGTIGHLGMDKQHIGAILHHSTGTNPARHRWQRQDGAYSLLEDEAPTGPAISAAHISVPN